MFKRGKKAILRSTTSASTNPGWKAILRSKLGLHLVYSPGSLFSFDIIFVHGLDGHPRHTWCKNEDPDLLWPGNWLPLDPDIAKARIFVFGYETNSIINPNYQHRQENQQYCNRSAFSNVTRAASA
jgi:hypothetical protein